MRIVLKQTFPLGRFHATPWRVNPFDDLHGEWPPSPFRLVRGVVARWYQWRREDPEAAGQSPDALIQALCKCDFSFYLPVHTWRGSPVRQYLPTEFGMDPPNFKAYENRFDLTKPVSYDKLAHAGAEEIEGGVVVVRVTKSEARASIEAMIGNRVSGWTPSVAGAAYEARFKPEKPISKALRSQLSKSKKSGAEIVSVEGGNVLIRVKKTKSKKSVERLVGDPRSDWTPRYPDPGLLGYTRSLSQDNYVCLSSGEDGAVWWFLDGDQWSGKLCQALEQCLIRMTYFGRAEAFTRIAAEPNAGTAPAANCILTLVRAAGSVPVIVPDTMAKREDIECITDEIKSVKRSLPPGARLMYALPPSRPAAIQVPVPPSVHRGTNFLQFAVGWNVPPNPSAVVRLTARFRGAVIKELLTSLMGDRKATWETAPPDVRSRIAEMTGKDAQGEPIPGHRHTEFLLWGEESALVRLIAWRDGRPFERNESEAILRAAERQFSWVAPPDSQAQVWKIRLVPLDGAVPRPPGFDGAASTFWQSVTPYVPPRHHLRGGKLRERESIEHQVRRELSSRGFDAARLVAVEELGNPEWVAVHLPRKERSRSAFIGDRRGYRLRLRFEVPIVGPIRLGHSSSFGLGLFRPIL
ncbi:MAG TPA: type I-U CRISPR-associated protein Csb2 [Nitrospiraceae bacterium]|nr:type I-U CRISPR-associated protein Csb2 [Nitrospiraceae bacterium]